jgi:hypothetical protein
VNRRVQCGGSGADVFRAAVARDGAEGRKGGGARVTMKPQAEKSPDAITILGLFACGIKT